MRSAVEKERVVVVVGPTGVGKTALSIRIAKEFSGEIVSLDSRAFYRGMDIGTAKPDEAERQGIRHHLIDVAEPGQSWSVAHFQTQARKTITDISQRGKLPVLVGGSGQYVWALLENWLPPEQAPNPRLRAILENWGNEIGAEALHAKLAILDSAAARRIDFSNMRRSIRALEVILSSGRRFSEQIRRGEGEYEALLIGVTRERGELYARIDQRINQMLEDGLIAEVRNLLEQGYQPQDGPMSAIGYQEVAQMLGGEINQEEVVRLMRRRTRRYIRQQYNWFKLEDPRIHWFNAGEGYEQQVFALLRNWLGDHPQG